MEPRASRNHPARLSPLTPLVRAPILLFAVLGVSWQQLIRPDRAFGLTTGVLFLLAVLAAGGLYGLASWWRTTYRIDGAELRIDKGVLARQSRRIRIDRLQGIDIVQPLLARLFGLAELRFDVASGADREGSLAFLPYAEAVRLRSVLLDRRDDLTGTAHPEHPAEAAAERVLARLSLGLLIASLVLSLETVVLVIVVAVVVVVFAFTGTVVVAGGVLPVLLGAGISLVRKLTSYYGFTVADTPAGLQVRRGLTALSHQTINLERVQGVVVSEPLPWRPFGWAKLEVSVAGYRRTDTDQVAASSTLVPVAPREEVLALAAHVLRGAGPESVVLVPPPRRARLRSPFTAWTMAFGQDDRLLVGRRGLWVRRTDAVPQARVQSLHLTQGPLQRRLRLADVHVDSPPGPVGVIGRHREVAGAAADLAAAVGYARHARHVRSRRPDATEAPVTEHTVRFR